LADFGFSRRLAEVSDSIYGMVAYVDPQCLNGKKSNKKSDVVVVWGRQQFKLATGKQ